MGVRKPCDTVSFALVAHGGQESLIGRGELTMAGHTHGFLYRQATRSVTSSLSAETLDSISTS